MTIAGDQPSATGDNPPWRRVWDFAWPMILANVSVPLLSLVDTAILGHLGDPRYLSAVAVGSSLIGLAYWAFSFLRMGTTAHAGRACGRGDTAAATVILQQSLMTGLAIGLLIPAIAAPLLPTAVRWMGAAGTVGHLAGEYSLIRLASAPATLMTYAVVGWLIGQQHPKLPLAIVVSSNLANIVLDYVLVMQLGLNSRGAAIGSLIAEYIGLAVGLICAARLLRGGLLAEIGRHVTRWRDYAAMMTINRHLFVRTVTLLLSFLFFTAQGTRQGEVVLAANAVLMNLLLATAYAMDGFAHAAEGLAGNAAAGGRLAQFYAVCRACALWSLLTAGLCTVIFAASGDDLARLFTDIPAVRATIGHYYPWLVALPLIAVWSYLLDGIFVGTGRSAAMQNTMLLSALAVYLPVWYATRSLGNHGLWFAFTAFTAARGVTLAWVFVKVSRCRDWIRQTKT